MSTVVQYYKDLTDGWQWIGNEKIPERVTSQNAIAFSRSPLHEERTRVCIRPSEPLEMTVGRNFTSAAYSDNYAINDSICGLAWSSRF